MEKVILESIITCPYCGFQEVAVMPTNSCQYLYDCHRCGALIKPKQGDCCVFCSYGSVKCPPVQLQNSSCCLNKSA